ncbi:MAG: SDR family NAD(P)-dependent oxidoreductase, partial [Anaeroplasmataceae bacterium]|nr:SDR family NAD(P)-dependent oxidoreductase [Anaeroplasmataceae bacterium]
MNVLITGATGELGSKLCQMFAYDKHYLILVGRNEEKLKKLSKNLKDNFSSPNDIICVDLRNEKSAEKIYLETQKLNVAIDILINAAGFGVYKDFLDREITIHKELIEVNILRLMELCHLFGQEMRNRRTGYIINFSSIAGFLPGPYLSTYYASKAFVLSFTLALSKELKPYNVSALAICPGVIDTPFYRKALADRKHSYLLDRTILSNSFKFAKKAYKIIGKKKRYYK